MLNDFGLTDEIYALIERLITNRDDIQSVSSHFDDERLWKILVAEQVCRAQKMDLRPQQAFRLNGPDCRSMPFPIDEWGGDVHLPYEGLAAGDLIISLRSPSILVGSAICHYFLTTVDVECNEKSRFKKIDKAGDWILYQSIYSYFPVYVLDERQTRPAPLA